MCAGNNDGEWSFGGLEKKTRGQRRTLGSLDTQTVTARNHLSPLLRQTSGSRDATVARQAFPPSQVRLVAVC